MGADSAAEAKHRLLYGRLAGVLFVAGALASIPVNQLFEPAVGPRAHWITVVGLLSGLACLLVPWDRLAPGWLDAMPSIAAGEVLLTMWGAGEHAQAYLWFLVFVVAYWAFAFEGRRRVLWHLGSVVAVAFYPVTAAPDETRANVLAETLVCVPVLLVATGVVVHLRERLLAAVGALAEEALRDPLTGLGNRRMLERLLDYEVTRHRRNGRPLSVIVLDLDGFKAINDTHGHPAGDAVLRRVGALLDATVREQDTAFRQGGDEFCVIAPETDAGEGAALLERITTAIAEVVGASAGGATFPDDAVTGAQLIAAADAEQLRHKANGRAAAATGR